jgi:hypothetical protein
MARLLMSIFVLATCLRVWVGPETDMPRAAAQIPDSGLQRRQMVEEIQRTNQLLEEIIHILKTQTIKVSLSSTDKSKIGAPAALPTGP